MQAARAEIGINVLAISYTGSSGEAAIALPNRFVRDLFMYHLLPQYFSGVAIQAEQHELKNFGGLFAPTASTAPARAAAELRTRQRGIKSFTQFILIQSATLL